MAEGNPTNWIEILKKTISLNHLFPLIFLYRKDRNPHVGAGRRYDPRQKVCRPGRFRPAESSSRFLHSFRKCPFNAELFQQAGRSRLQQYLIVSYGSHCEITRNLTMKNRFQEILVPFLREYVGGHPFPCRSVRTVFQSGIPSSCGTRRIDNERWDRSRFDQVRFALGRSHGTCIVPHSQVFARSTLKH